MKDVLDAIIYYSELSRDQQQALFDTLSTEPELVHLFNRWQRIKEEIRSSLDASIPDRDHLVLYALQQNKDDYLTAEEQAILASSLPGIEKALHKHPSLSLIVENIQEAQADFLQLWSDSFEQQEGKAGTATLFHLPSYFANRALRIAAVFLVACLSLYSALNVWQNSRIETITNAENSLQTVHFDDGSKVRLVGASELSFAKTGLLSSFNRQVTLAGQAFFDVSPNEKPFTVQSATAITKATGTQFSIDAKVNQTEVVLTKGEITLESSQIEGIPVTLSPGQRSSVFLGQLPTSPELVSDMTAQLSWTGLFIFHRSPLTSVTSYLGDHFDTEIEVAESLEQEPFNATFNPDTLSLDEALETLSIAFDARIDTVRTLEENTYFLSPFATE